MTKRRVFSVKRRGLKGAEGRRVGVNNRTRHRTSYLVIESKPPRKARKTRRKERDANKRGSVLERGSLHRFGSLPKAAVTAALSKTLPRPTNALGQAVGTAVPSRPHQISPAARWDSTPYLRLANFKVRTPNSSIIYITGMPMMPCI